MIFDQFLSTVECICEGALGAVQMFRSFTQPQAQMYSQAVPTFGQPQPPCYPPVTPAQYYPTPMLIPVVLQVPVYQPIPTMMQYPMRTSNVWGY